MTPCFGRCFPLLWCGSPDLHTSGLSNMMALVEEMIDFDKVIEGEKGTLRLQLGSCILREPEYAASVESAMLYKRGNGHRVHAWCIMPNHVHAVVTMSPGLLLNEWLGSIKKYSSREINSMRGESGALWERESFSHLLRSEACFERACDYVEENPVSAGLCAARSEWRFSSAHPDAVRDSLENFVPPHMTAFVEPRSRGELTHIIKEHGSYFVTFRLIDSVVLDER